MDQFNVGKLKRHQQDQLRKDQSNFSPKQGAPTYCNLMNGCQYQFKPTTRRKTNNKDEV